MRKTILICSLFLLIPYHVFAAGPVIYEWMNTTAVCSAKEAAPVAESTTINAYQDLSATNAYGQSFDPGGDITLYSLALNFHDTSDACVINVRIGATDNLTDGNYIVTIAYTSTIGIAVECRIVKLYGMRPGKTRRSDKQEQQCE